MNNSLYVGYIVLLCHVLAMFDIITDNDLPEMSLGYAERANSI